jgi:hypothetical protein
VIAARMISSILDEFGQHGFNCERCTDEDKEFRGCGVAPKMYGVDDVTFEESWTTWDVSRWRDEMFAAGLPEDGEQATMSWRFANLGGVVDALNMPWPMCPRYYDAFATPSASTVARIVMRWARFKRSSALSAVLHGRLTPWAAHLLDVVDAMHAELSRQAIKKSATK